MTPNELRSSIRSALKSAGFSGTGSTWRWQGAEVTWLVKLDRSPHGERYSLDIGADLLERSATRPNDCGLLIHLENLAPIRQSEDRDSVLQAFDLGSGLDAPERENVIEATMSAVISYLTSLGTFGQVKARFDAGDFTPAFLHKDVRELLVV